MKIKVLLVPTLIIASSFVALNYLKPGYDTYQQKRALRAIAEENARQVDTVVNNVGALKAEIETQKDKVAFTKEYLPEGKDQGRIFDGMNFLAGQSGLLTSKIQVEKVEDQAPADGSQTFGTLDPLADADPLTQIESSDPNAVPGAPLVAPYVPPKIQNHAVSLEALGGYPNIKDLLRKLTSFNRLQEVQSFRIAVTETAGEEGEAPAGVLTLNYSTKLPYQNVPSPVTGEAIVSIPGLSQGSFNFATIDSLQGTSTTVPDVVLGTEGKANPFE